MQNILFYLSKEIVIINSISITGEKIIFEFILPVLFLFLGKIILARLILFVLTINVFKKGKTNAIEKQREYRMIQRAKKISSLVFVVGFIWIILSFLSLLTVVARFFSIFSAPIFSSGKTKISFLSLFGIGFLVYFSNVLSLYLKKTSTTVFSLNKNKNTRFFKRLSGIIRYVSFFLFFLVGLPVLGIDISSLTVVFGALGIGIGFGLQDSIANIVAGITISFTRIITEGDRVFIQGIEGNVQKINLLNTVVRAVTEEELIIPNKYITSEPIQNFSHTDPKIIISSVVQVSYTSDLEKVEKVIFKSTRKM